MDTCALEMCCSDTISIGIVWEKYVWRQRASFRPVTPSYHFVFTGGCAAHSLEYFTLISVTVCKGADWGNSVALCCRGTGVLRRTPPGFKLLTHAFIWRKQSLQKSVAARGEKHAQQANGLEEGFRNEGISLQNEVTVRTRLPEVDALTAADGAWVTASLQKMSHVALSHILTSAGRTNASNKLE